MIVSLNWLKQYTPITRSIDELVELIGARLVEIEEVVDLQARYADALIVEIVNVEDHPDAERLHVVEINDNGAREGVDRLDNGNIQVVCGAPNARAGIKVVWLPPGATVPSTFADAEPFVLDSRKLRGVMSHGMLASAKELVFSDDHDGIMEVDKSEASAGDSFVKTYELDDYLLDIENKSLTHRPDCFGLVGFAREVAAIQGEVFQTPEWLKALEPHLGDKAKTSVKAPQARIANPELSARYEAVVVANAKIAQQSPLQIQSYLSRVGMRPISAIVDITNYLMLVTGQPLHAFDYDKFISVGGSDHPHITVREAHEGETLELLDGKTIQLATSDIIIASGDTPVALAGAMGGKSTQIDDSTKHILLESATFDLYRLRTTQMRHGIFSEAITRFTKGQPAPLTAPVIASAVRMLCDIAGAERASDIIDSYSHPVSLPTLSIPLKTIQGVLGADLSMSEAIAPLEAAEFSVDVEAPYTVVVQAPYWRADIHRAEDVIEEIGRIRGFDTITPALPQRDFRAIRLTSFDDFRKTLRSLLVRAGADEVLTYGFVHGNTLKKAGQSPDKAYRIVNAISPDLQYYRLSLTPSLLDKVHTNLRQRFDSFALFEIGKVHQKDHFDKEEKDVPAEFHSLALTIAANPKAARGTAFYTAKQLLEFTLQRYGIEARYEPYVIKDIVQPALSMPFEPKRTALVKVNDAVVGVVGEYKQSVVSAFKLPEYAAGFEIDIAKLHSLLPANPYTYTSEARFPGTEQDICVQVNPNTTYQEVLDTVKDALAEESLEWQVSPVDIYQPESAEYKNITLRIHLRNRERTISTDEASVVIVYLTDALLSNLSDAKIV